jgi:electron transfer flavoprotein alpha subunit
MAVLVKQIPAVEEMQMNDGHLVRTGTDVEMSAFCRRAVSKAVELGMSTQSSSITVISLGPPPAADVLREAIVWGRDRGVDIRGVLLTDPTFAGSDTIATARALAAVLEREGPFDLILTGKNSLDADTGQVPPQVAQLLDFAFASGVKQLELDGHVLRLGCEHDDSWAELELRLPALLSCAERLCEPAKVPAARRAEVPDDLTTTLTAADLGPGPWGASASLTRVGECRSMSVARERRVDPKASVAVQVRTAARELLDRGALVPGEPKRALALPPTQGQGRVVAVIGDPGHEGLTRDLCGHSARLASELGGSTVLLAPYEVSAAEVGSWGADRLVHIADTQSYEDVAHAAAAWASSVQPWAILATSTAQGREVASRVAASIGAGLTGDAAILEVIAGRLVAWKPAFGGQLVAAVTATSAIQMATVRAGVLPLSGTREHIAERSTIAATPRGRVRVQSRRREDSVEVLDGADVVIGVGQGVSPDEIHKLDMLAKVLGAELGCTRKVTDAGWMPHARQIGVTGRAIAPRLYVAIGTSGKFNHMVGVRAAHTVLAINPDPDALVWQHADIGVVARFQDCVPLLVDELRQVRRNAS